MENRHEPTITAGQAAAGREGAGYSGSMAVRVQTVLDAAKLRADFPIFEQVINGKPLSYLNSAATSQKPRQVLDAMTEFYETSYSNVHRGVYTLGERATAGLEGAREKVRAFVNAPSEREIIFVRNATEGLNLVAYAYGLARLGPGDVVRDHPARAPLELRPVAVHREPHRRRLPDHPDRRQRRPACLDEVASART